MAISFVNAVNTTEAASDTSYVLTKPSSTTAGDFYIATLAFRSDGSQVSISTPSGWTKVREAMSTATEFPDEHLQMAVFTKVDNGSEPSTWSGTLGSSRGAKVMIVSAYRGAGGLLVHGIGTAGTTTSFSTPSVNNTINTSWRVIGGAYESSTTNFLIVSNEVVKRTFASTDGNVQSALWDSNAAIVAGNTSRTVSREQIWGGACAFIGIIQSGGTGVLDVDIIRPTMGFTGTHSNDATLSMTAPFPSMTMDGIFIDNIGGPLIADVAVGMNVVGGVPITGTLEIVAVEFQFLGETPPVGPRKVTIDAESRTYYATLE